MPPKKDPKATAQDQEVRRRFDLHSQTEERMSFGVTPGSSPIGQ